MIQSDWGNISVQSIKLPTQNGQWLVADVFKPDTATRDNPAPLVVVIPGFQRSKEALSNTAIELARRGMVTMSIDPYAQGSSSSSLSRRAATTEGYGMFALVDYAYDTPNLNYVDKQRIAATGHSAGGNAAIRGAAYFGKQADQTGQPSKLHSVYVSGYVITLRENVLRHVRSNVGVAYALYDEGAFRNTAPDIPGAAENKWILADMRTLPNSVKTVNSGLSPAEQVTEVELGRYYGNLDDRSLRVIFNEKILHPFQPYMREAMANQIEYFETVFNWQSPMPKDDQVWYWKELLSMISMVAAMVMVIPLGHLLLVNIPYFGVIVKPLPKPQPKPAGKGKVVFWGLFVIGATIAAFSYIPMTNLSIVMFPDASDRIMTWFFPQRMNNGVMLWALFNGTVGFLLFYLSYKFFGKKRGISSEMWGTQVSLGELGRTFVLALLIFLCYYLLLFAIYYFFHVDYRFLFMGVRPFQPVLVLLMLMYVPMFFVFFLSNSLRVNGAMRIEGQPEWRSMLLAGVANSLGLFLIIVVQYVTFAWTGTVFWSAADGVQSWLYINLLFAVVPIMFVLPYFNRYFFRMTGRIYLGPMTMCLIFIMILLSNTVCYTPL
jgi:hypothetical protein